MTLQAKVWVHKKSGKQYKVKTLGCQMKVDGVWKACAIYTSVDPNVTKTFVRSMSDFLEKFGTV